MEAVVFIGIQASGKSSFYKEKFFKSHVRINLDMLKTRYREKILINACLESKQKFVIDNTNVLVEDRKQYFEIIKKYCFKMTGYYFQSSIKDAINRNDKRIGIERIPIVGIKSTHSKLEIPNLNEGFDNLFYVRIKDGIFIVEEWDCEI